MTTGTWIAVAAVLVALAFGGYRTLTAGRFRPAGRAVPLVGRAARPSTASPVGRAARPSTAERVETTQTSETSESTATPDPTPGTVWATLADAAGVARGDRATLVQFSSAFCAPCRATRRVLSDVAREVPGVVHVELDAEHHLEVVRRLKVLRTPTTLVLDATGREVARASGAPRKEQVLGVLP